MIHTNIPEVKFALNAVRLASLLVRQVQAELVSSGRSSITKDDRSPVTVADFASQALVGYLLSRAFPHDPMVAEEDSLALRSGPAAHTLDQVVHFVSRFASQATPDRVCEWIDRGGLDPAPRFWVLDPIDGTKGFLRGDQYAVALALVQDGQVQLGALGCPDLSDGFRPDIGGPGSIVIAMRGEGSWTTHLTSPGEFERLRVSAREDAAMARILRSFESGHTNVSQIDLFAQALGVQVDPVRMDSQAKYAVLSAGKADLLLRLLSPSQPGYKEKVWDQAAGSLVLEEAGGRITDLDGRALDFNTGRVLANNRGILASNELLHPAALQALQSINA
jgi:3'(2'), 5'-bisphosphate nucleotidase